MQHCRCIIANIGNVRLVSVRLHAMCNVSACADCDGRR